MLSRGRSDPLGPGTSGALLALGIGVLILGIVTAAVASRLGKGSNGARLLVSVIQALHIAGAIANLVIGGRGSAAPRTP